ncbi:hypothetical protein C0W96_02115 [Photobacterium kishitanii]|uniref:hypothetical protein n=1 Tax=Photobacterium kishitanii TaxID=318456 RepID=UPI0005D33777|nr:hypothetical protein [Photobacterium kishitanii]KJG10734.1 hypothetical protein UB40_05090 [Photobacterium kishitanii]PSV08071.1 hypothetical protein C0W96_02115 [Photobacterium kishitanii]PSV75457.1 hypothetical protein C0W29_11345 [Photobacterium kishitanii]
MFYEFLKFGYLGLLAILVILCYKIIENGTKNNRPLKETLIILTFFSSLSLIGGTVGYLWASKELEVARAKESTAEILKQQINTIIQLHNNSMAPLQLALKNSTEKMTESYLSTLREQYMREIDQINTVIQGREPELEKRISALNTVFNQVEQAKG